MNDLIEIRTFVHGLLANKGVHQDLPDDAALVSSGYLDSTDVLQIVLFLEERFSIDFSIVDFDPDLFDSIDNIASLTGHPSGPSTKSSLGEIGID